MATQTDPTEESGPDQRTATERASCGAEHNWPKETPDPSELPFAFVILLVPSCVINSSTSGGGTTPVLVSNQK